MTEHFLWDFRRAIGDLFAENDFGHMKTLSNQHGMQLMLEPYGQGIFNDAQVADYCDVPMNEFWVNTRYGKSNRAKLIAGSGHVSGRELNTEEAFTSRPSTYNWDIHPYSIKATGNSQYANGINGFVFHRFDEDSKTHTAERLSVIASNQC